MNQQQDLRKMDDATLLNRTLDLVKQERRVGVEILHHLREVERRQLYLQRGYPSLYAYCMEALGYSEGATQRRLLAMRLLRDLPPTSAVEIEQKIQDGTLSLSVIAQAQTFFKQEQSTFETKTEILKTLVGKSAREAERELASRSSQPVIPKDLARPISKNQTQITFTADDELMRELEELRHLLSHKNPNMSWAELFTELSQIARKKLNPLAKKPRKPLVENLRSVPTAMCLPTATPLPTPTPESARELKSGSTRMPSTNSLSRRTSNSRTRYIEAPVRRELEPLRKDGCTYQDSITHRTCGSQHLLQLDHIIPFHLGGDNTAENLRWRCARHNRLTAGQDSVSAELVELGSCQF